MLAYEGYGEYLSNGHILISQDLQQKLKEHEKIKIIILKEETKNDSKELISFLKNQDPWSEDDIEPILKAREEVNKKHFKKIDIKK